MVQMSAHAGIMRSLCCLLLVVMTGFGLAACGGTAPTAAEACPRAPFVLPSNPSGQGLTPAEMSGKYRTLGVGGSVVVAAGAMHSDIVLARGVSDNDFAVSLYAHGPSALQPVTVLGEEALLYPGVDLPGPGYLVGRIPFAAGPDRVTNACSRWELRASGAGIGTSELAAYAEGIDQAH